MDTTCQLYVSKPCLQLRGLKFYSRYHIPHFGSVIIHSVFQFRPGFNGQFFFDKVGLSQKNMLV